jgi:hypothetical protein
MYDIDEPTRFVLTEMPNRKGRPHAKRELTAEHCRDLAHQLLDARHGYVYISQCVDRTRPKA